MDSKNISKVKLNCVSCVLDFSTNLNSFIDHMTDTHADDAIQCTYCGDDVFSSGNEYAMHFIYSHCENANEHLATNCASVPSSSNGGLDVETFSCPKCTFVTNLPEDLATHFETVHSDTNSDYETKKNVASGVNRDDLTANGDTSACPVCSGNIALDKLNDHVNMHFDRDQSSSPGTQDVTSADYRFALELEKQERDALRQAESKEFEALQEEYGMDERGSYKQQGMSALDRAYGKGQLTIGQLYDAKQRLNMNEVGIEDPNYPTKMQTFLPPDSDNFVFIFFFDLIERIRELSRRCADVLDVHLCTTVDHYSSSQADFGFGCGYRNIQMLMSSLRHSEMYKKALWGTGPVHMPSIPKLQELIEKAWEKGFDSTGRAQLNGTLRNSRKWIGVTEAAVLLESHRIKVRLIDVHGPTGPNSTHPSMLRWCYDYFKEAARQAFVPPLYFQHQGHSRTIIGVERTRSGQFRLLVFDPSHSRQRMQQLATMADLKLFRKSATDLKKPKYQLMAVEGIMENDAELEWFKTNFVFTKIPPQAP